MNCSSNSNAGKKINIPFKVRRSLETMKSSDLSEDFDDNSDEEEDEDEDSSDDEESIAKPSENVTSTRSDIDLTNVRDDLTYFVDLCCRSTKLTEDDKKVYMKLVNMIYITCELIATDVVYQKFQSKGFTVNLYAAEAMDSVISNIRLRTDTYSFQRFFSLLPGQTVPIEVIQKYQSESKSTKILKAFSKECNSECKDPNFDKEQLYKANYGHRVLAAAASARQFIQSNIKDHFMPTAALPSGESPVAHLYQVRRAVFEGTKPKKVRKAINNAVSYRVKPQVTVNLVEDSEPGKETEENQPKKKKVKPSVDKVEKAAVKEEVAETQTNKVKAKGFKDNWYPKEWLAFLLLAQPAAEKALQYLIPYDPQESALRQQGQWTPSVIHPPHVIKKEDSTSSDNKSSLTSSLSTTH